VSIGKVLGDAWGLYTRFFTKFILVAIPVFLVLGLVNALVGLAADEGALAGVVWGLIGVAISVVGYFWLQGALIESVRDVRDGRADLSVGEIYSRVQPRLPALIVAGVLAGIGVAIGFILLIVPGLFLLTRWALITPAIVIERRSAGESFTRSWELVKGASWSMLGLILVTVILAGIAGAVIAVLFVWLPDFFDDWVGSLVANSLTAPFVALAWTLAYFERAGAGMPETAPAPDAPV
jgi:Membrane domain of glycerophosphoryl diester phosphodiesterase